MVFFSRIGEIFPFLANIHINLLSFSATFVLFLFAGEYKTIEWNRNSAAKLIVLFFFLGLLTVPFAIWPTNALDAWQEYIMINSLICFFCLASIQNEKQITRAVHAFLVGTFLIVSALHINPIYTDTGRAFVAYSYDPNDLAMIFAVTFPMVVGQLFVADKKWRILLSLYLILLISGILKTGSRGGMLALVVAILLILFSSVVKVKLCYKSLVVIVIVVLLQTLVVETVFERWEDVLSGQDYNLVDTVEGTGGRIGIWKGGLRLFGENFFFGVGVGNSSTAMGERFGQYGWMTMHNAYLQTAVEMGIGGIIVLLLILHTIWRDCSQAIKDYAEHSLNKSIFSIAYSLRISLLTLMVASFFLSQAYSIIIPFFLIIAYKAKFLVSESNSERGI